MSKRLVVHGLWLGGVLVIAAGCGTGPDRAAASASALPTASVAAVSSPTATVAPTPSPSPTASPTATPEPTPTPTPTAKPTPTPWASYTSKRFKYTMKHPPDWIVTPGSTSRSDIIDDFATHYVYAYRDTVSTWVDVEGTVSGQKAFMKSHYKAKLLSDKKVSVGAYSGRLLIFTGSSDGRKVYIQHLIIARGKVGYLVTMFSDPGAEAADRKIFLRMYNSFKPTS